MHWDGYTIFSVLSGGILAIVGLCAQGVSIRDRAYGFLGGSFFFGYGFYVAKQTSGTFFFPIWIFIIPPGGIIYLIAAAVTYNHHAAAAQTSNPHRVVPAQRNVNAKTPDAIPNLPGPGSHQIPQYPEERPNTTA